MHDDRSEHKVCVSWCCVYRMIVFPSSIDLGMKSKKVHGVSNDRVAFLVRARLSMMTIVGCDDAGQKSEDHIMSVHFVTRDREAGSLTSVKVLVNEVISENHEM